jgi:RNA polymerase sigma-70 factor (ECF subfamily)
MSTRPATTPVAEQFTDEDLVARIVEGDTALFEILMRRHNQRIYRAVRAILRDDIDIEDVMQQAYLSTYQHLRQFSGEARFSTWMTRIAVNEAIARLKKRGRWDGIDMEIADTSSRTPEEEAKNSELRQLLEQEIAALPASFRAVLMLRDVEGMSTAEAAQCLEISEDLVKTRLHRARTMLRDHLQRRADLTMDSLFAFGNERCDRVVAAVMSEISSGH